jgi:hypothetical protein
MEKSNFLAKRRIAGCLVVILMTPFAEASAATQQHTGGSAPQSGASVQDKQQEPDDQPNAPVAGTPEPETVEPVSPGPVGSRVPQPAEQSNTSQAPAEQQNGDTKPVGTAAAPYEKTTGVTASRPAGAVIAPAKQRRARAFFIRVAIVAGAAVAIGIVVALSRGSSSRP